LLLSDSFFFVSLLELSTGPGFFVRTNFTTKAAMPPVDITLPATTAALAKHAGHMGPSFEIIFDCVIVD
jgi:hypothetical protein